MFFSRLSACFLSFVLALGGFFGWKPVQPPIVSPPEEVETMEITSDYVIVKSASARDAELTAVNTLKDILFQMSGITFEVVDDTSTPYTAREIIVGATNREGYHDSSVYILDRPALGAEGVFIKTVGETVVITGGAPRGTLYAVYTFLEDYLGCRWFSKDLTVIPEVDSLEIPREIDYFHVPVLEFRETDWISPRDVTWSVANKMNGLVYRYLDSSVGGGVGYAGGSFAHTLEWLVPKSYFETDPEMFALGVKSGKRTVSQPCLTNEKTLAVAIENVRAWLDSSPDRQIISVTQNDNTDYCVCANCRAIDAAEGSQAGTMLRFINAIADELKKYPQYDHVAVDTFAYQYTRKPPKITVPRDNVIVRLCSIECCFSHPLNDPCCERNVAFANDLYTWKKICNRLYVWDYTTNYANFLGPFPNFGVIQPNMKFFMENNVVGIYEEGNYQAAESDGEFADLRAYLLAKLLWDCDIDLDRCMKEFCEAYYGEAAEYILEYIYMTTAKTGQKSIFGQRQHMGIFEYIGNACVMKLSIFDIFHTDGLWENAKNADLTEEQLTRVLKSEISWRYWKATNKVREFGLLTRYESSQQLYSDIKALGITRIHEGAGGLMADKVYFMDPPGRWSTSRVPAIILF
ncbi:MAG: DUF4838 domain-containing protein [Oscillospiraceae bacterium]|nr:DUF4838 domain-containing protein [Oscillospiraceae bacterium]